MAERVESKRPFAIWDERGGPPIVRARNGKRARNVTVRLSRRPACDDCYIVRDAPSHPAPGPDAMAPE
jgi:hypothetical protein